MLFSDDQELWPVVLTSSVTVGRIIGVEDNDFQYCCEADGCGLVVESWFSHGN